MLAKEFKKKLAIIRACSAKQAFPQVCINDGWIQPLTPDSVIPQFRMEGTEGMNGCVGLKQLQDLAGAMLEVNVSGIDSTEDNLVVCDKNGASFDVPMTQQEGLVFDGVEWKEEEYPIGDLQKHLKSCASFASEDKTRPVLAGIYVGADVVGADGYVLRMIPLTDPLPELVLPALTAKAIEGCTDMSVGTRVAEGNVHDYVSFMGKGVVVEVACPFGRYPNYNAVIPSAPWAEVSTTAEKLRQVFKVASLKEQDCTHEGACVKRTRINTDAKGCYMNGIEIAKGLYCDRDIFLVTRNLKTVINNLEGEVKIRLIDRTQHIVFEDERGLIVLAIANID